MGRHSKNRIRLANKNRQIDKKIQELDEESQETPIAQT